MITVRRVNRLTVIVTAVLAAFLVSACAATTTSTTTWTAPPSGDWARPGRVESVQETVRRTEGNPAAGALAGALIGGFLFHGRGPARLFGAAGGAAVGAAASQGRAEDLTFQVLVRFDDDGEYGMFLYRNYSPFQPGELVVLTPRGLARR
jgi:outer membrane lipoprotein SlyB